MDSTSGQDTAFTTVASVSGQQDTEVTSIIGFAAVLVILVAAVLAVIFLCTCYGLCKLHSRPAENRTQGTSDRARRRAMIPLPSPRELPATLNAKRKSSSFQNSPLAVDLTPISAPPTVVGMLHSPALIHLARPPPLALRDQQRSDGPQLAIAQTRSLQLHPVHAGPGCIEARHFNGLMETTDSSKTVVKLNGKLCEGRSSERCITPGSASGDTRQPAHLGRTTVSVVTACSIADTATQNQDKISSYSTQV